MKIGDFSRMCDTPIDTIRYYMQEGLLTVIKNGGHYEFNNHTEEQLKFIKELKSFGFTLKEIRDAMLFMSYSPLIYSDTLKYKWDLYQRKQKQVSEEIQNLEAIKLSLNEKLNSLDTGMKGNRKIGFPIKALELLQCRKCKTSLEISSSQMIQGEVLKGTLTCECGFELLIEEGIVIDKSSITTYDTFGKREILNYLEETPLNYLVETQKSMSWLMKKMEDSNGKTILDLGSGLGMFIRNAIDRIDESALIILNDICREHMAFLKNTFEKSEHKHKIVFLACDLKQLPLKEKSVDVLSAIGTPTLMIEKDLSMMSHIHQVLKDKSDLLVLESVYTHVDYRNTYFHNLNDRLKKERIEEDYKNYGYQCHSNHMGSLLTNTGKFEPLIQEKDKAYMYSMYYKR